MAISRESDPISQSFEMAGSCGLMDGSDLLTILFKEGQRVLLGFEHGKIFFKELVPNYRAVFVLPSASITNSFEYDTPSVKDAHKAWGIFFACDAPEEIKQKFLEILEENLGSLI